MSNSMKYDYCIPMDRNKMRKILARAFYGDYVLGYDLYIQKYYPGKYRPINREYKKGLTSQ